MAQLSVSQWKRTGRFQTADFLLEAIEEFLESGSDARKIASCIIKTATATELLLKDKMVKLCPPLVLDSIDPGGLQVAKFCGLSRNLLNPKDLDHISIKTAPLPALLRRTAYFFDLRGFKDDLAKLRKIRNELILRSKQIDVAEVNLLLINKVFPFFEQFTKDDKYLKFWLPADKWKELKALAQWSTDFVATEISKKLAHHAGAVKKMSSARINTLASAKPEKGENKEVVETELLCPACKNESMTVISAWDVDTDETGYVSGVHYFVMQCRVCGLEVDDDEIRTVISEFEKFFGKDRQQELEMWGASVAEQDYSEY